MRYRQYDPPLHASLREGLVGGTLKPTSVRRDNDLLERAEPFERRPPLQLGMADATGEYVALGEQRTPAKTGRRTLCGMKGEVDIALFRLPAPFRPLPGECRATYCVAGSAPATRWPIHRNRSQRPARHPVPRPGRTGWPARPRVPGPARPGAAARATPRHVPSGACRGDRVAAGGRRISRAVWPDGRSPTAGRSSAARQRA